MTKHYDFMKPQPGFNVHEPQTLDDVKQSFITSGEAAKTALETGDVAEGRKLGWLRVKDGKFGLKPGYGKNNQFVPSKNYLEKDYKVYQSNDALAIVNSMLEAAYDGVFDDGLERIFDRNQKMIKKREAGMEAHRKQYFKANVAPQFGSVEFKAQIVAA